MRAIKRIGIAHSICHEYGNPIIAWMMAKTMRVGTNLKSAMTVAEMGTAIKAKTLEVDYSHQLLSELDIETRREVGVWLHGHVQSFNLSMARRMRALGSHVARELADEIDVFTDKNIRAFSHQLYPQYFLNPLHMPSRHSSSSDLTQWLVCDMELHLSKADFVLTYLLP